MFKLRFSPGSQASLMEFDALLESGLGAALGKRKLVQGPPRSVFEVVTARKNVQVPDDFLSGLGALDGITTVEFDVAARELLPVGFGVIADRVSGWKCKGSNNRGGFDWVFSFPAESFSDFSFVSSVRLFDLCRFEGSWVARALGVGSYEELVSYLVDEFGVVSVTSGEVTQINGEVQPFTELVLPVGVSSRFVAIVVSLGVWCEFVAASGVVGVLGADGVVKFYS